MFGKMLGGLGGVLFIVFICAITLLSFLLIGGVVIAILKAVLIASGYKAGFATPMAELITFVCFVCFCAGVVLNEQRKGEIASNKWISWLMLSLIISSISAPISAWSTYSITSGIFIGCSIFLVSIIGGGVCCGVCYLVVEQKRRLETKRWRVEWQKEKDREQQKALVRAEEARKESLERAKRQKQEAREMAEWARKAEIDELIHGD